MSDDSDSPWPLLRERLLRKYPTEGAPESERSLQDSTVDWLELESARRRERLIALRAFDANATLDEELQMRLVGDNAMGALRFNIGQALFAPFQDTVAALSDSSIELELSGVSPGSTVLHVQPSRDSATPSEDRRVAGVEIDSSPADVAIRRVLRLFDAAEGEEDVRNYARALRPASRFADACSTFNLDVQLTWAASDGELRQAMLTGRGRRYLRRVTETESQTSLFAVQGYVTELRFSGHVRIKAFGSQQSPSYDVLVEPTMLLGMQLSLGRSVNWLTERTIEVDQFGRETSASYRFVAPQGEGQGYHLPFEDS